MLEPLTFEPLAVRCRVAAPICSPSRQLSLDGLLAAAAVYRTGQPLALSPADCAPAEIPIQRSPCGRFHLASFAQFAIEQRAKGYTNKRFPTAEAQAMGDPKTMRRILITAGVTKSFRIPREHLHLRDDEVLWYCHGNRLLVLDLVQSITALGKKRSVGLGAVVLGSWRVDPIEPWDGFPVVLNGRPLRTLPVDWPGLTEYEPAMATLTYPYHDRAREQPCATMMREA